MPLVEWSAVRVIHNNTLCTIDGDGGRGRHSLGSHGEIHAHSRSDLLLMLHATSTSTVIAEGGATIRGGFVLVPHIGFVLELQNDQLSALSTSLL
jgi:hypothetical protein